MAVLAADGEHVGVGRFVEFDGENVAVLVGAFEQLGACCVVGMDMTVDLCLSCVYSSFVFSCSTCAPGRNRTCDLGIRRI